MSGAPLTALRRRSARARRGPSRRRAAVKSARGRARCRAAAHDARTADDPAPSARLFRAIRPAATVKSRRCSGVKSLIVASRRNVLVVSLLV